MIFKIKCHIRVCPPPNEQVNQLFSHIPGRRRLRIKATDTYANPSCAIGGTLNYTPAYSPAFCYFAGMKYSSEIRRTAVDRCKSIFGKQATMFAVQLNGNWYNDEPGFSAECHRKRQVPQLEHDISGCHEVNANVGRSYTKSQTDRNKDSVHRIPCDVISNASFRNSPVAGTFL